MARSKKLREPDAGTPAWMVTYGDAMTLLLCFFVIIVSMSEMKKDQKFMDVMESLRVAFGGYKGSVGAVPLENTPANTIIEQLLKLEIPEKMLQRANTNEQGLQGKEWRVTNVRNGTQVVIGGRITYDRFSATLKPAARHLIGQAAEIIRGYNTKILVRGHATHEPLPEDSIYDDARALSYARAAAAAKALEEHGVRSDRLMLVAVGDNEPLARQAYTEERRALNRRVEILVTEDLIEDYAGTTLPEDEKEFSDGG